MRPGEGAAVATALRTRIESLDLLRGGAVFLVVLHHVLVFLHGRWFQPLPLLVTLDWVLSFARMPVLLLISGFLASGLVAAPGQRIRRRVANLTWILVMWTPILLAARGELTLGEAQRVVAQVALPDTELWFIWALAVLTLVPVLARAGVRPLLLLVAAYACSVAIWAGWLRSPFFAGEQVGRYAMFFVIGCFYLRTDYLPVVRTWPVTICGTFLIFGALFHLMKAGDGGSLFYALLAPLEALCFGLGAIAVASTIDARWLADNPLVQLGRNTLPVYVCHVPLILLLAGIDLAPRGLMNAIMPLCVTLAVIAGCLAIHRLSIACGLRFMFTLPTWLQRAA